MEIFLVVAVRRAMRHVTGAVAKSLEGKLEAFAKPEAEKEDDGKRLDAPPPADGDVGAAIRDATRAAMKAAEESGPQLKAATATAAKRTVKHSQNEFVRLKLDLRIKREPDFDKLIATATKDVAARFKGTVESQIEKLEAILDDGFSMRHETLAKEIARQLDDVSESRAEFLARDAVLSINSKITTARMKSAGIARFAWTTSGDERVRDSHADLDGQIFSYDDPPVVDGEPALPGEPPLCRCTAFPELPELDEEDEAA